jgi:hypothetical protein
MMRFYILRIIASTRTSSVSRASFVAKSRDLASTLAVAHPMGTLNERGERHVYKTGEEVD